ncbi:MAG: hypothetical protein JXR31_14720 [Prolixibacteraceae bacterium]|nr:hypothetical protein [Prolixibacteraceae bacterium]MBN2775506.1 hypothetical protein [Prolixibacteraceae bacterium]
MKLINANKKLLFFIPALFLLASVNVNGQDDEDDCSLAFSIPEIALLDIEPTGMSNISLTLTTNPESGLPVATSGATNDDLWINYTSCLATGSSNRSVSVHIASGSVPGGLRLRLTSSSYSGSGQGSFGTPAGTINLSATPQTIISGIGRCYTGNGQNNGHKLNYSLSISNYNLLKYNNSTTIQIAFTLTDN